MNGTVTEFDEAKGYGAIAADDGRAYFFHCTQIADGTRTIARGAVVRFDLRPWHRGQVEAVAVAPR